MYCMGVDHVELTVTLFVASTCIIAWVKPHSPKLVHHDEALVQNPERGSLTEDVL